MAVVVVILHLYQFNSLLLVYLLIKTMFDGIKDSVYT